MLRFFTFLSIVLFPVLAFAAADGNGGGGSGAATPEIPAGAAPIIVAGIVGAVMLVRNRRNKKK